MSSKSKLGLTIMCISIVLMAVEVFKAFSGSANIETAIVGLFVLLVAIGIFVLIIKSLGSR